MQIIQSNSKIGGVWLFMFERAQWILEFKYRILFLDFDFRTFGTVVFCALVSQIIAYAAYISSQRYEQKYISNTLKQKNNYYPLL